MKQATQRIYKVTVGDSPTLVRANSKSQAVQYVVRPLIVVEVASQDDIASLVEKGMRVMNANEAAAVGA